MAGEDARRAQALKPPAVLADDSGPRSPGTGTVGAPTGTGTGTFIQVHVLLAVPLPVPSTCTSTQVGLLRYS